MPTILNYAGVDAPDDLPGYSLRPAIEGGEIEGARDALIGRLDSHRAGTDFRGDEIEDTGNPMGRPQLAYYLRNDRWHFMMLPETDEIALYDLKKDPGQTKDVAPQNRKLVERFKEQIAVWREKYDS